MSTVVHRPSGRTPGPTNLGHRIQFRLTTSLKAYLIPPGYEAKLRPSALLSYKGKRCFPLHKGNAGLFDSVAFAHESFQNFLFPSVLPSEETPYKTSVFVVVVYRPFGRTPGPTHLGHGSVPTTNTDDRYGFPMSRQCPLCISVVGANALFGT